MATETIRPNGVGSETSITTVVGSATHWGAVDEAVADEDTTAVKNYSSSYHRDLYTLPAHAGTGTITNVTIYFRCRGPSDTYDGHVKSALKTNATVVDGTAQTLPFQGAPYPYTTYSQSYDNNPVTSAAWTWDEIDALEIGLSLQCDSNNSDWNSWCTQVYAIVTYADDVTVTPTTKATTLTAYALVLKLTITPATLALVLTTYAPTVTVDSGNVTVTPATLALVLTTYTPVLKLVVTPTTKALTTTTYAPVLKLTVTPTTLALVLTTYAPTVTVSRRLYIVSTLSNDLSITSALSRDLAIASVLSRDLEIESTLR